MAFDKAPEISNYSLSGDAATTTARFKITKPGQWFIRMDVKYGGKTFSSGPADLDNGLPIGYGVIVSVDPPCVAQKDPPTSGCTGVPGPVTIAPPGYVGGKLIASQGSYTKGIALSWNPAPTGYTYNVYRLDKSVVPHVYRKLTDAPIDTAGAVDLQEDTLERTYMVRSVNSAGKESADSTPATGYANLPPVSLEAWLKADKNKRSGQQPYWIADPNMTAKQKEVFNLEILQGPAAGQGTVVAESGGLVWIPPDDFSFSGDTWFTFRVTDKGGASIDGRGYVTVTSPIPPAPKSFLASRGSKTDMIRFTWDPMIGFSEYIATGYNIYRVDVTPQIKINSAPITDNKWDYITYDYAAYPYQVRAITTVGESLPSSPDVVGWANGAIKTAYVSPIAATAITASAPTPITVEDPNIAAGETEVLKVTIVDQPPKGEGTAKVMSDGKLVWVPPKEFNFSGRTSFTFAVIDNGGESVVANAIVNVAPKAGDTPPSTIASARVAKSVAMVPPQAALLCAKKFLLLGENNGLATRVPVQVTLTYMKNESTNCGGATGLETVFMASTDNRNFVPLDTATGFVGNPAATGNSVSDQVAFQLTKPGTYFFRALSRIGSNSTGSGVYKVTVK